MKKVRHYLAVILLWIAYKVDGQWLSTFLKTNIEEKGVNDNA